MLTSYRKTKVYCKGPPFLNWTNDFRKTLEHLYQCAQSKSKLTKLGQATWSRGINKVISCPSRVPSSVSKTYPSSITLSSSPLTAPVSMYQLRHLLFLPGPILSFPLPSFPNSNSTMTRRNTQPRLNLSPRLFSPIQITRVKTSFTVGGENLKPYTVPSAHGMGTILNPIRSTHPIVFARSSAYLSSSIILYMMSS